MIAQEVYNTAYKIHCIKFILLIFYFSFQVQSLLVHLVSGAMGQTEPLSRTIKFHQEFDLSRNLLYQVFPRLKS